MSKNKKIGFSPIELMVFVEACAEQANISCERYDLHNQLGSKVLDKLELQDSVEGKSSKSSKIGRNANDWLKKAELYQTTKPHDKIKISESSCSTHMNFIGVNSSEDFKDKFAKQIEQKKETFEGKALKRQESKPDKNYKISARFFPSFLCLMPLIVIGAIISFELLSKINGFIIAGLLLILWPLLAELLYRAFVSNSKKYENQLFNCRKMFPTTELLLRKDTFYSKSFKIKFSNKTKQEFGMGLPTLETEEENLTEAIAEINSVIAAVKSKLINHKMVLNHNISYGFIRNLIGGAPFAIGTSLIGVFMGLFLLSPVLIGIELLFVIGFWTFYKKRKSQLTNAAFAYARQLIDEYIKS